jgi:hypothetical protein
VCTIRRVFSPDLAGTGPTVSNKPSLFYICSEKSRNSSQSPYVEAISISKPAFGTAFGDGAVRRRERIGTTGKGQIRPYRARAVAADRNGGRDGKSQSSTTSEMLSAS